MNIQVELSYSPYIKITDKITLPEKQLQLTFVSATYKNLQLKVFVRQHGKVAVYHITDNEKNNTIDLTNKLVAGVLEIEIVNIVHGAIAKRWEIIPLTVIEVTPQFVLKDMLHSLEERIEALEKKHETIL